MRSCFWKIRIKSNWFQVAHFSHFCQHCSWCNEFTNNLKRKGNNGNNRHANWTGGKINYEKMKLISLVFRSHITNTDIIIITTTKREEVWRSRLILSLPRESDNTSRWCWRSPIGLGRDLSSATISRYYCSSSAYQIQVPEVSMKTRSFQMPWPYGSSMTSVAIPMITSMTWLMREITQDMTVLSDPDFIHAIQRSSKIQINWT